MRFHPEAFTNATPITLLVGKSDLTPTRLNRSFREAVESEIERLIDLLDAAEPDADSEPYLTGTWGDDREGDDADDEDSDETGCGDYQGLLEQERGEGSDLSSTEALNQDEAWQLPAFSDGEASLGWVENHGAGYIHSAEADAGQDDREDDAGDCRESDPAESGIGDMDGLLEQTGTAA